LPLQGDKLIVANFSGFFGDRFDAAREMIEGGPIDVLTGDYLAELTMAILLKQTFKDPNKGYAHTFLKQMEQVMGPCLDSDKENPSGNEEAYAYLRMSVMDPDPKVDIPKSLIA